MRIKGWLRRAACAAAIWVGSWVGVWAACPAFGQASGGAFTYQGVLQRDGRALSGVVDLRFTLHASAEGGEAVGEPVELPGVEVANGLVTAALDFGPGAFSGAPRWLGVEVREGAGAWTALAPRTPVSPAPHALFAHEAAGGVGEAPAEWVDTSGLPERSEVDVWVAVDGGASQRAGLLHEAEFVPGPQGPGMSRVSVARAWTGDLSWAEFVQSGAADPGAEAEVTLRIRVRGVGETVYTIEGARPLAWETARTQRDGLVEILILRPGAFDRVFTPDGGGEDTPAAPLLRASGAGAFFDHGGKPRILWGGAELALTSVRATPTIAVEGPGTRPLGPLVLRRCVLTDGTLWTSFRQRGNAVVEVIASGAGVSLPPFPGRAQIDTWRIVTAEDGLPVEELELSPWATPAR